MAEDGPCEDLQELFLDRNFVVMGLYVPVAVLALVCNILVIVVVIKFQYMQNVTNYFLVNLSVADLLVTIVCMPNGALSAYTRLWLFDEITCKLANYMQCISVASSVFTITAMALDRYLAITQPFGFCRCFTRKSTILVIIGMWITSMVIFSPLLIVTKMTAEPISVYVCNKTENATVHFCSENWEALEEHLPRAVYGAVMFCIMFAIPGIIILWAYSMMGKTLCSVQPPFDNNSISNQQSYRLMRERKRVAWILLLLVLLFAICWLPYNMITLLRDYNYFDMNIDPSSYYQYLGLLGHANSALNPLIYCLMSRNFRNKIKQMIFRTRVNLESRRNHRLQRMNTGPLHIQVHMTLSRLQSSQKTTKTCAV